MSKLHGAVSCATLAAAVLVVAGGGSVRAESHPSQGGPLTPPAADAQLRAYVRRTVQRALFPATQGTYCPAIYIVDRVAQCFAEYHVGDEWGFIGASLRVKGGVTRVGVVQTGPANRSGFFTQTNWRRRWVPCPRPASWRISGELESNNACGAGNYGGTDWGLITQLWVAAPGGLRFQFYPSVSWQFTDVDGYKLASFDGVKVGGSYTFTNVVGDAFRYRP